MLERTAVVTVFEALRVQLRFSSAVNASEGNTAVVCFAATGTNQLEGQTFQLDLSLEVIDVSTSKLEFQVRRAWEKVGGKNCNAMLSVRSPYYNL